VMQLKMLVHLEHWFPEWQDNYMPFLIILETYLHIDATKIMVQNVLMVEPNIFLVLPSNGCVLFCCCIIKFSKNDLVLVSFNTISFELFKSCDSVYRTIFERS